MQLVWQTPAAFCAFVRCHAQRDIHKFVAMKHTLNFPNNYNIYKRSNKPFKEIDTSEQWVRTENRTVHSTQEGLTDAATSYNSPAGWPRGSNGRKLWKRQDAFTRSSHSHWHHGIRQNGRPWHHRPRRCSVSVVAQHLDIDTRVGEEQSAARLQSSRSAQQNTMTMKQNH